MGEPKPQDSKTWAIVTLGVAIIGCISVIGAALINALPEITKVTPSQPTSVIISTATSSYPTPIPTTSSLAFTASISTYVKDIKFFETAYGSNPKLKVYSTIFTSETARYIDWELTLGYPEPPGQEIGFIIHTVYYKPDGSIFGKQDSNWSVPYNSIGVILSNGMGWADAGHWEKGTYTVILYVNQIEIARASFIME